MSRYHIEMEHQPWPEWSWYVHRGSGGYLASGWSFTKWGGERAARRAIRRIEKYGSVNRTHSVVVDAP